MRDSMRRYTALALAAFKDQRGAFAMTVQGFGSVIQTPVMQVAGPVPPIQIADAAFPASAGTGDRLVGATQNLVYACSAFRVVIYLKAFVLGTSSAAGNGPLFTVEGSNSATFASGIYASGLHQAQNIAGATLTQEIEILWRAPVVPVQYFRIVVDSTLSTGGSMAGTYDALIEAAP